MRLRTLSSDPVPLLLGMLYLTAAPHKCVVRCGQCFHGLDVDMFAWCV